MGYGLWAIGYELWVIPEYLPVFMLRCVPHNINTLYEDR
jgi:hypothetical protein